MCTIYILRNAGVTGLGDAGIGDKIALLLLLAPNEVDAEGVDSPSVISFNLRMDLECPFPFLEVATSEIALQNFNDFMNVSTELTSTGTDVPLSNSA